ncbi:ABC transporter G family member 23-like [Ctenocephalides felis]|uniref:ABC transporter G family member 23-like n=1 Tax=Ctenocephalides felis TaxID=7515 RepID=UPI000E6E4B0B|nr:ABC transporter G family member 23-like [Ctenocephalides felis]
MFVNKSEDVPDFDKYKDEHPSDMSVSHPFEVSQQSQSISIEIVNGHKWFGKMCFRKKVLNGFNMKVPENHLYCLIGPKCCGKTTILRAMAGLQPLDKGFIEYRGRCLPILESSLIGYMPQEHGLHPRLTLRETFKLHGGLLDMAREYLQDRIFVVMHLMQLPDLDLKISDMTFDQLCRTSFALAFLHEPDFILLDEPTVGSDATLRNEFRACMRGLLTNRRTNVIMTSHDFDEAYFCDTLGLMRDGCMIAEGPPNAIIEALGAKSIVGIFYITSVGRGHTDYKRLLSEFGHGGINIGFGERLHVPKFAPVRHIPPRISIIVRLISANLRILTRQIIRALALFILPAVYIFLFGLSVGPSPSYIKLSYMEQKKFLSYKNYNNESYNLDGYHNFTYNDIIQNTSTGPNLLLSNLVLNGLSKRFDMLKEVESVVSGKESVARDDAHAFLWFPQRANLTEPHIAIYYRHTKDWTAPDLELYVDPTRYMMQEVIKDTVVQEFREAANTYYTQNFSRPDDPVIIDGFSRKIEGPEAGVLVWGGVSGVSLALASMLSVTMHDISERIRAEGVTSCEIQAAHLFLNLIVLCLQNVLLLLAAAIVTNIWDYTIILALMRCWVILGGNTFCGIALGVLLSTMLRNKLSSMRAVVYIMWLIFLVSGVFWPIEGIGWPLHRAGWPFPVQHVALSMRFLVLRDMKLTQFFPWFGFLLAGLWGVLLYIATYTVGRICP